MVTLSGKDFYLGKWNTRASRAEYDRVIKDWLAGGRSLSPTDGGGTTIAELALAYWKHAKSYYRKDGKPTDTLDGIRVILRMLRQPHGNTLASDFGPLRLKALQADMIDRGLSRSYVNANVHRIRRVFRWGVAEQLVPATVYQAPTAVAGLRKGRTTAREPEPVRPVGDEVVDATLCQLTEVIADMVRLQRLTGCRPSEVCIIRPCDVDRSGDIWLFRPISHKTEHHDRDRVICIGPKAQDVLRPYLLRDKESFCFVPAESERKRNSQRRESRQSVTTSAQAKFRPKRSRRRLPGNRYTTRSYRRAIHRACDRAGIERWGPNRLRHSAATEIRRQFGLEAAQVTLGHATADVSQIYAERDLSLAVEIMRKIG